MHIIGLTGGIASGKSLVSHFLEEHYQLVLIDADHLARQAVEKGTPGLEKIVEIFGEVVLQDDGNLNRKALGKIIAEDDWAKTKLEAIVHPQVESLYQKQIKDHQKRGTKLIIYDCPLLFEANLENSVDEIFLVVADEAIRVKRIINRDQVTEDLAFKKIRMQMSDGEKEKRADLIIENNGSIDDLLTTLSQYCSLGEIFVKKK